MNRRDFIKHTFGTALSAVAVAYCFQPQRGESAIAFLARWWNDQTRGQRGQAPRLIEIGQELHEQFLREVLTDHNLVPPPGVKTIAFKTCRAVKGGPGWYVKRLA